MGIQQGLVTITGYVAKEPRRVGDTGRTPLCVMRLASTRSYYDAKSQLWKELPTTWISVKAHRSLANNVLASVHKGDPVIVTGTLGMDEWSKDGQPQSSLVIEANAIGHDLSLGSTSFSKLGNRSESTSALRASENDASSNERSETGLAFPSRTRVSQETGIREDADDVVF
jgi:single-strand DNA-binding protein